MTNYYLKTVPEKKFKKLPIVGNSLAFTFYPCVYVRAGWEYHTWLIKHEEVHINQQKRMGKWKWLFKYATDKKFRLEQEIPAHKAAIKHGQSIEKAAGQLSRNYNLDLTYAEARARLQ